MLDFLKQLLKRQTQYIVWNPSKVVSYTSLDEETLIGLVEAEYNMNASVSSVVRTSDIEDLINSIHNETDVKLCYATYKEYREYEDINNDRY